MNKFKINDFAIQPASLSPFLVVDTDENGIYLTSLGGSPVIFGREEDWDRVPPRPLAFDVDTMQMTDLISEHQMPEWSLDYVVERTVHGRAYVDLDGKTVFIARFNSDNTDEFSGYRWRVSKVIEVEAGFGE